MQVVLEQVHIEQKDNASKSRERQRKGHGWSREIRQRIDLSKMRAEKRPSGERNGSG